MTSLPIDELTRVSRLHMLRILDTPPERVYDETVALAARLCAAPICVVSLVDETRQWFKARIGVSLCETQREHAFCNRTIQSDQPYIVEDAFKDPGLRDNPLVAGGPRIRFYAGVPLMLSDGARVGALCVMDTVPRAIGELQLQSLTVLAHQLSTVLDLRYALEVGNELRRREQLLHEQLLNEAVADNERRAVALHEGIAQDLAGGRLLLDTLAQSHALGHDAVVRVQLLSDLLRDAIDDCRALATSEGALVLGSEGLGGALRHLALRNAPDAPGSVPIEVRIDPRTPKRLNAMWEHHLYRIAELALGHTRGQPARTGISLALATTGSGLTLGIEGAGAGEVNDAAANAVLETLRFRAALLGGTVQIERLGERTRVTATVPWPVSESQAAQRA